MNRNARGFTLIEMLVVLAILAILAAVAISSVDGIQDQSRYDATQRGLQNIEEAILGPENQHNPDGTPIVSGFVADIGRLPNATALTGVLKSDGSQAFDMVELWLKPAAIDNFAIKQGIVANITSAITDGVPVATPGPTEEDSEVFVPCGWRGPYIRLGVGQTNLKDGYGNFYDLLQSDRTYCTDGIPAKIIRSRGSNAAVDNAPTGDYREDLYENFITNSFDGVSPNYPIAAASDKVSAASFHVTVLNSDNTQLDTSTMTVKCFGPDPATGKIKVIALTTTATAIVAGQMSQEFVFTDPSLTVGPRIIRAYQNGRKSAIKRVVLQSAGTQTELFIK